jgi:hypothetical protein
LHSDNSECKKRIDTRDERRRPSDNERHSGARKPCYTFKNTGNCKFGDLCRYNHDFASDVDSEVDDIRNVHEKDDNDEEDGNSAEASLKALKNGHA